VAVLFFLHQQFFLQQEKNYNSARRIEHRNGSIHSIEDLAYTKAHVGAKSHLYKYLRNAKNMLSNLGVALVSLGKVKGYTVSQSELAGPKAAPLGRKQKQI